MLDIKQVSVSLENVVSKPLLCSQKLELSSMGQIWEDCWGSAVLNFRLVQLALGGPPIWAAKVSDLICTRPPMMGFVGWKMVCMGEVPVAVVELEAVEDMLCSSTINWVSHIYWVLWPAGMGTESS